MPMTMQSVFLNSKLSIFCFKTYLLEGITKEKKERRKREKLKKQLQIALNFKKKQNLNIYNIFCSNICPKLLGSKLAKGNMVNLHVMSGLCIFFDYFVLSTGWCLKNYKTFT